MHTNQRPLNSKIDSVNVPGGASETGVLQTLELIAQQNKQIIKLMCSMNLMLGAITNMEIDPDTAFNLSGLE